MLSGETDKTTSTGTELNPLRDPKMPRFSMMSAMATRRQRPTHHSHKDLVWTKQFGDRTMSNSGKNHSSMLSRPWFAASAMALGMSTMAFAGYITERLLADNYACTAGESG